MNKKNENSDEVFLIQARGSEAEGPRIVLVMSSTHDGTSGVGWYASDGASNAKARKLAES